MVAVIDPAASPLVAKIGTEQHPSHDTFKICLTVPATQPLGSFSGPAFVSFSESGEGLLKGFRHNLRGVCGRYFAET